MANFEVLSLDPTTPQIRAPGAGDGYSVPRNMTFASGTNLTLSGGTANGVLYLNGSKVATSGSALTFDGSTLTNTGSSTGTIFNAIVNTDAAGSSITDERIVFAMGGSLGFGITGWANAGIVEAASTGGLYLGAFNGPINFASGASARNINMTLTASGNLGIGTTSPTNTAGYTTLHVVGSSGGLFRLNNSGGTIQCYGGSDTAGGFIGTSTNHPFILYTNGSEKARIDTSGNFKVGTTLFGTRVAISGTNAATGTTVNGSVEGMLLLRTTSSDANAGPEIAFASGYDGGGVNSITGATIKSYKVPGAGSGADQYDHGLIFKTSNSTTLSVTEKVRITPAGNVGIGTSSPQAKLDVSAPLSSNGPTIRLSTTGTTASSGQQIGAVDFYNSDADIPGVAAYVRALAGQSFGTGGDLIFGTQATYPSGVLSERARITSGGSLLVGKTADNTTTLGAQITSGGIFNSAGTTDFWNSYSTSAAAYRFYVSNAGTIFATNTTISAISDQRFKENIRDLDVGLSAILALKPRKFDWKEGQGKDIKDDRGFIAQEFEQVFPDLVDEWKDSAPEGEEPYKSVRQDLIPVLVKAIQELKAELDATKAKVAQLEAR